MTNELVKACFIQFLNTEISLAEYNCKPTYHRNGEEFHRSETQIKTNKQRMAMFTAIRDYLEENQ